MSTKPANEATWQCPKCKRWQSHKRGICLSEFDTGIPCDGKQPHPAAPADAGDAKRVVEVLQELERFTDTGREAYERTTGAGWTIAAHVNEEIKKVLPVAHRLLDAPPGVGERMREALEKLDRFDFYYAAMMLHDAGEYVKYDEVLEAFAAPAPAEAARAKAGETKDQT